MENEHSDLSRFSIAIPASVVSDTPHLREKTAKLGAIARASSIFGVSEIILYSDDQRRGQETDMNFCADILQYLETPQYLRRRIFPLSPTLRFTGILPPLQAPHHNVPPTMASVRVGDVREGLVTSRRGLELVVDVGLEKCASVSGSRKVGERVSLRLVGVGKNLRGEIVERSKISTPEDDTRPAYWGYRVHKAASLRKALERGWDVKIGTSRYGVPVQELLPSLFKALHTAQSTIVAFGSPRMGIGEILKEEKLQPKDVFDYFVNTAPDQRTATVRTEEAILITLGILNLAEKLTG